ncbi:hypothetical protein GJ744_005545 [Endocarpon pusillum]|uniref:Heterokaryon incompatibility domain-containing protein n=1 Tax=Endocarpon pusillum TaxID=364733 RepID=A0A8H7E599_9EURO|nr:hypothetical protein GJ744_005545 [Endocarpon pusillum]
MTNPLESAHAHLQKGEQHLELSKLHYEGAKATYQSAKAVYEAVEASHLSLESRSSLTFLCDSCATISIPNIFDTALTTKAHRRKVGDLFQAVEGQSSCVLCKFLIEAFQLGDPEHSERLHAHLKPRDTAIYFTSDPDGRPWFRKAGVNTNLSSCPFVWLQTGRPTQTGQPHICISFEPRSSVDAKPKPLEKMTYPRRRDPLEAFNGSINYDLVMSWLKKCDTQHGSACNGEQPHPSQNIFLIDVQQRRVVRGQKHDRYVALSYVWGKGPDAQFSWFFSRKESQTTTSATSQICTDLPTLIPQTMEDAITFVKRIDERYLWVDLFCIDQSNTEQKQIQIDSMDRIYAAACLTLVCLDGQDADWGLPGVSRPMLQTNQPTVALGAGRLTATYIYSVWDNNGNSVWDTRAWTLQERLLSRRCIMFANTYMSMACQAEFFHDSMNASFEESGVKSWLGDDYFREDGSGIDLNEEEWDFKTFDALVSVFSGRKLTQESDVFNACRGALNKISSKTGCSFYFGLPNDDILRALLWKPHHDHILTRRPEFPSWSWLGWSGRTEYAYWLGDMSGYLAEVSEAEGPPIKKRRIDIFKPSTPHPENGKVLSYGTEAGGKPSIRLSSTVAKFKLRLVRPHGTVHRNLSSNSQQPKKAVGDHWALLNPAGYALRNLAGEHHIFEHTDVCFRLQPQYSTFLLQQKSEAEFLFIQQWPRIRDSEASNKWLYDLVSALLIIRNEDNTAWRLTSVLMKAEEWHAQKPLDETVVLV